jgi:hypothetical protein
LQAKEEKNENLKVEALEQPTVRDVEMVSVKDEIKV